MPLPILARVLLGAMLLGACGCSSENKGKIEGNWLSLAATVHGEALPAAARQLTFGNDGKMLYRAGAKVYNGIYSLGMGPAVTFQLEEELEGRKIHPRKIVIDGGQLTLTEADGSEMKFQKTN